MSSDLTELKVFRSDARAVRWAWGFWAVFFVLIATLSLDGRKSVTPNYEDAARHWMAGEPLYTMDGMGFIYLPQAAIIHIPFVLVPAKATAVLWRAFTVGLFAAGVWRLSRLARREFGRELFPAISLVAVPLAWSSARNGQSTLAIAGLTMLAAHDLASSHWNRATFWLLAGLALKPLIAAPLLLAAVLYPGMAVRLVVGLAAFLVAPFLTQSAAYVWSQYQLVPRMLSIATVQGQGIYWAEPFSVLMILGVDVPHEVRTVVRLIAAVLTLALCWRAARNFSPQRTAILLYTLSAAYIMLFNPRTENNTYSFIGPAVGLQFAHAWLVLRDRRRVALLAAMAVGIVGSFELGRLVTSREQAVWLAPTLCATFVLYVIWQMVLDERRMGGITAAVDDAQRRREADNRRRVA